MAQILMPQQKEKEDPLATIMKGLTIASQIYGIRSNMAQIEDYQAKAAKSKRVSQGVYDKNDQLALSEKYDISKEQPSSGSYQTITDEASNSPMYLSMKKDNAPILKEIKGVNNGQYGTFVKNYRTNEVVDFIPDQAAKPERVEYLDKSGNKVIQYVEPKAGLSFTSFEKPKEAPLVAVETIDDQGSQVKKFVKPTEGQSFPVAKAPEKNSKEQFDAALFGRRIESANQVLDDLAQEGYDRSSYLEGAKSFILPESSYSPQLKQQKQAERNFINAVLRRESGAAIGKAEFENAELQYFPRAGDTAEVLAQKAQSRQQALEGLKAAAGTAWDKVPMVAKTPPKKDTSGQALAAPKESSALEQLKMKAAAGDEEAKLYLKSLGEGR